MKPCIHIATLLLSSLMISGCTAIAIVDTVATTTVKAGGAVIGTAIDVTRAGVRAVTSSDAADQDTPADDQTNADQERQD
ncbi:hypothetical protein [Undibacterium squillarum]|uniref:Lipoprotein n=1 Tax=Undibacterium squillarum TaxID=1131567 RepID=A0ABQ2Y3A7_9BURK|nr:hypothetical protein [Undibacterium squillarum]GGX50591.1 hypothetical protein GCM10010946_31670 [Undibacterium squillarum]